MTVGDVVWVMAVFDVRGDGLHRPRPVKGNHGDQVFQRDGPQTYKHLAHPGGFELEHPVGLPRSQHSKRILVVGGDFFDVKIRGVPPDHFAGVVNDGQIAKAQKIHLEEAQLLQGDHGILADDGVVVLGQGDVVHHRFLGDYHAGGVRGGVPRHPFQLAGGVDELVNLGVVFIAGPQLRGHAQRPVDGHFQFHGHELRHPVHCGVGDSQGPAHVPYSRPGGQGPEGDNLSHMVRAVLTYHVIDDLLAALVAKVNVKVGHGHPLRV